MSKPNYLIYNTVEVEALPSGTYLALFHGRKDPKQHLEDWGFGGPVIGPVQYVQTTYASEVKVCLLGQHEPSITIPIVDHCAEFEGNFYGDWSVYQHKQRRVEQRSVDVDRRKA